MAYLFIYLHIFYTFDISKSWNGSSQLVGMGFTLGSEFLYLDGVAFTNQLLTLNLLLAVSDYFYLDPNPKIHPPS